MEVYTPDFEPLLSRDDDRIPEGLITKETHMCGSPKAFEAPHEGILSPRAYYLSFILEFLKWGVIFVCLGVIQIEVRKVIILKN